MIKKYIAAACIACIGMAATAQYDTMYLIKGDRVVGKYNVDDVDYASFTLPEGVNDNAIWLDVNNIGKNKVTYTVNTVNPNIGYAHGLVSYYMAEATAQSYFGGSFDLLEKEQQVSILQSCLATSAYFGVDTQSYTHTDYQPDGFTYGDYVSRFSVVPGTHYFLCVWQADPITQEPLENFVYTEFDTLKPGKSNADINFTFTGTNERGAAFNVEASSDVVYVRTSWGPKSTMDLFNEVYGLDFLFGAFGELYDIPYLQGSDEIEGIVNATWPLNGSESYVMFVRAYDAEGNITDRRVEVFVEEKSEDQGPAINIFTKSKGNGSVSVNFEISPSNVEEAYVRLCSENFVDDRLNMGYDLKDIAMGGDAEDITSAINTMGEYTFSADGLEEEWKALLIYAKDKDGHSTTLRINFFPDTETEWAIYNPVYKMPRKITKIRTRNNPSLPR